MSVRPLLYADCVLPLPLARSFQYRIPASLRGRLRVGQRVRLPFGPRRLVGFVTGIGSTPQIKQGRYKEILALIDAEPLLTQEQLELARWLAETTCCGEGEALTAILPQTLRGSAQTVVGDRPAATAPARPANPAATRALQQALIQHRHQVFVAMPALGAVLVDWCLPAIAAALRLDRSVLLLAPEMAMVTAWASRCASAGHRAIAWHSDLPARQRASAWQTALRSAPCLIVGTRSAVLLPLDRLGLVIIDQEHDTAYKQPEVPRYQTRTVALERARRHRAVVVLASATPSLETYQAAQQRRYTLVRVPAPPAFRPPAVTIVDRRNLRSFKRQAAPVLSPTLELALRSAVTQQRPALLFLNRRGFATYITCLSCGAVMRCERCEVALTFHYSRRELVCHYCNAHQPAPEHCPVCHKGYLRYRGSGTEKVESEVYRLFPEIATQRLDADVRRGRAVAAAEPLAARFIVGTQLATRGLPLQQLRVVGVVSADTPLHLPDFRAGEQVFALLMRLAGHVQSGSEGGQMVVQTAMPLHPVMQAVRALDYRRFARHELSQRRRLGLPPYRHLIELSLRCHTREQAEAGSRALTQALLKVAPRSAVWGPAPGIPAVSRGWHHWRVFLKGRDPAVLRRTVRRVVGESRRFQGNPVFVDVDP